jgi:cobalamin biosynthesis protein CobT
MSDTQFKLQINFTKSYVGEDGNHYLEGVASGPEVDLTDERMSPEALKSMVSSIKKRLVEFRDAHKQEWNDDLGEVVELSLDESNHLIYRSVLDMNLSGSKDLWYRVHTLGKKYGVSIGGAVLKAGMEYVAELGRQVYTYFDVDLYEISITRQAAYQYSFANAVLKSLPKGTPMPDSATQAEVEKTDADESTETQTEETTQETVAAEDQSDATQTQTEGQKVETEEATEDAADQSDAETETTEESTEVEGEFEKSTEAEAETHEVAKSAVLGSYAEAGTCNGMFGT